MSLPKWIPKRFRSMMVTSRPANDSDDADDLLLRDFQKEAMLQSQFQTDKIRAVKNIAQKIHNKKEFIKRARDNSRKMLQEQLEALEEEQFELLRDEILNVVKDSAGLIDYEKLKKVPGSNAFFKKNKEDKKPKN